MTTYLWLFTCAEVFLLLSSVVFTTVALVHLRDQNVNILLPASIETLVVAILSILLKVTYECVRTDKYQIGRYEMPVCSYCFFHLLDFVEVSLLISTIVIASLAIDMEEARHDLVVAELSLACVALLVKLLYETMRESSKSEYRIVDVLDVESSGTKHRTFKERNKNMRRST